MNNKILLKQSPGVELDLRADLFWGSWKVGTTVMRYPVLYLLQRDSAAILGGVRSVGEQLTARLSIDDDYFNSDGEIERTFDDITDAKEWIHREVLSRMNWIKWIGDRSRLCDTAAPLTRMFDSSLREAHNLAKDSVRLNQLTINGNDGVCLNLIADAERIDFLRIQETVFRPHRDFNLRQNGQKVEFVFERRPEINEFFTFQLAKSSYVRVHFVGSSTPWEIPTRRCTSGGTADYISLIVDSKYLSTRLNGGILIRIIDGSTSVDTFDSIWAYDGRLVHIRDTGLHYIHTDKWVALESFLGQDIPNVKELSLLEERLLKAGRRIRKVTWEEVMNDKDLAE